MQPLSGVCPPEFFASVRRKHLIKFIGNLDKRVSKLLPTRLDRIYTLPLAFIEVLLLGGNPRVPVNLFHFSLLAS